MGLNFLILAMTLVLFAGCESPYDVEFNKSPITTQESSGTPTSGSPGLPPACTETLETTQQKVIVLFMVDHSGSTMNYSSGFDATDPNFFYRDTNIRNLVNTHRTNPNLQYAFGYFNEFGYFFKQVGATSHFYNFSQCASSPSNCNYPVLFGPSLIPPTDTSAATDPLSALKQRASVNHTYYNEAFKALKVVVQNDISAADWNFAVVFMSDGRANDPDNDSSQFYETMVSGLIDTATKKSPLRFLTVSTIYFGPADNSIAIARLTSMAKAGKGIFKNTNDQAATDLLQLNKIITIRKPGCTD